MFDFLLIDLKNRLISSSTCRSEFKNLGKGPMPSLFPSGHSTRGVNLSFRVKPTVIPKKHIIVSFKSLKIIL